MKATADDMESIGLSMIWGDPQLLGKYDMPSGTVFRSKQLLAIYFDAFCFKVRGMVIYYDITMICTGLVVEMQLLPYIRSAAPHRHPTPVITPTPPLSSRRRMATAAATWIPSMSRL